MFSFNQYFQMKNILLETSCPILANAQVVDHNLTPIWFTVGEGRLSSLIYAVILILDKSLLSSYLFVEAGTYFYLFLFSFKLKN